MNEIVTSLIDKILWVVFIFSVLGLIRFGYTFVINLMHTPPKPLSFTNRERVYLGIYVAVIITSIFTGIGL